MTHRKYIMHEGQPSVVIYIEQIKISDVLLSKVPGEHIGKELFYVMPEYEYEKMVKAIPWKVNMNAFIIAYAGFYETSRETAKRLFDQPHTPGKSPFKDEEWANRNYNSPMNIKTEKILLGEIITDEHGDSEKGVYNTLLKGEYITGKDIKKALEVEFYKDGIPPAEHFDKWINEARSADKDESNPTLFLCKEENIEYELEYFIQEE